MIETVLPVSDSMLKNNKSGDPIWDVTTLVLFGIVGYDIFQKLLIIRVG